MSFFPSILRPTWSILYWLPTGIFLSSYFHVKTITGRSMQPTLNPDSSRSRDVALYSRYAVRIARDYERDDIVTLRSPDDPNRMLLKRIIAMEGDTVQTLPPYPDKEVTIPPGHVWVEGDEHFVSYDSNNFGPVPQALLDSKLIMLIWPLERFGPIKKSNSEARRGSKEERRVLDELKREQSRQSRVRVSTNVS